MIKTRREVLRGARKRRLEIERLEDLTLLSNSAIPHVALTIPPEALIGTQVNFTVGFQNASTTTTGYAPYVDLILPRTGDEGPSPSNPDGITFASATYLGQAVTSTVLTFDFSGHATHPYAVDTSGNHLVMSGTAGDQLVVLQLPFGSFTPGQPTATINVNVNLSNQADVGSAQMIESEGGFALGNTPLNDYATDPSIVGVQTSGAVTGELYILKETYNGPEDETATGPNFPRQNTISVAIAPGQTITNLDLTDALPNNLQYMSVVETSIRGTSTPTTALSTPSTSTPGGTVTQQFASVTGTGAANDVTMTVQYYVPLKDSTAASVIDPTTGAAVTSTDTSSAQGTWTPLNPNDVTGVYASNTATHVLNDRSLATQKSVTDLTHPSGSIPGDTLEYTVSFQVSDYFAFQNLILSDLISDGQHFDMTFTPTLQVNGGTFTLATQAMNAANYTVTGNYTGATPPPTNPDGTTTAAFRISNEMVTREQNGQLIGGLVSGSSFSTAPGNGPVTGTITFRTVIQNSFTNT